jgi:hypothetical protein
VTKADRERWDALCTLARAARRSNGGMWGGKLAEYADAILGADDDMRDKNRALRETHWRLGVFLMRGDLAPDDEPITRKWRARVGRAI